MDLEERLDFIEFRQDLLFDNDELSRFIYECKFTRKEYLEIEDLMEEYRKKIDKGEKVSSADFETRMSEIAPEHAKDYHTCEIMAKLFSDDEKWEEVFPALYGNNPKYLHLNAE